MSGSSESRIINRLPGADMHLKAISPPGPESKNTQLEGELKRPASNTDINLSDEEWGKLAQSRFDSFQQNGELNDIDEAIEYGITALGLTPKAHPHILRRLGNLGAFHFVRFRRLGEPHDIEKAIEYNTRALDMTPSDHPTIPQRLTYLGWCYYSQFQRLGELNDVEKAIEYNTRALDLTPNNHPDLPRRFASLGASHYDRFQRLGGLDDIQKSIEYEIRALDLTPTNHPDFPNRLESLGASYFVRFQRLGELVDIEASIVYETRAVDLTPTDHPDLPHRLASIGSSHYVRFQRLSELNDIEKSIEYNNRAVDLTPSDHPDLPRRLASLGVSYCIRFQRLDESNDIERSIEYTIRAVNLTPSDHPELPHRLTSLGSSYYVRFQRRNELDDIERSIEYNTRAVDLTPSGHPDFSRRLASLGVSHFNRFNRLGDLDDVEKAIEYETRAVDITPSDHPDMPHRLASLGSSYYVRFQRLGELGDIQKSIEYKTRALDLTPTDHPDLPHRLDVLGVAYHERSQLLGELDDVEKSIKCKTRAVGLTPDDHPNLPRHLASLGVSYFVRFQHLGELNDIKKSIEYRARAVDLTPSGHPDLPDRLSGLGSSYSGRFRLLGNLQDLNNAVELHARASNLVPDDHPSVPFRRNKLAQVLFSSFQHTGDSSILQHSLNSFRLASHCPTGAPRVRFQNALIWATCASEHAFLKPLEAYQTAINLLPQFIWLGATTAQRYQDLQAAEGLSTKAASVAILSLQYELALTWLEHTRCVVWNQSLMLRSPLDELQSSQPDLVSRLQTVARQLHDAGSQSSTPPALSSDSLKVTPEQYGQHRRRLAKDYKDLLAQAQALSGCENLLRPVHAKGLIRAARYGPIVTLNCHKDLCAALIIVPGRGSITHFPLPDCNEQKIQEARSALVTSLRNKGIRERGFKPLHQPGQKDKIQSVMLILWKTIVKPVLDFLGYTSDITTDSLPHITWCPTGAMSFLPLHAAGDYDRPRSRVFDYVISSYTPTITALLSFTPSVLTRTSRILAIGQATTPGRSPLPGTATELEYVRACTDGKAQYSQLMNEQATIATVLDAMEQHDWVHLACHAHQNVQDPTRSGFFLHDGTLDLASINRRSFRNKGLAFLSACQTATGDERLPDEAIHLASGMLMAGYASVIGTMWSVSDSDAPFVADKVYAELMKDGKVGNGEAGRALHHAISALREQVGEKNFGRWVPYIHIGS
ncbi:unnamed protein product [Rhizoctonia solani]|uniref:CHAT domain-containing protein n=1 Tax=Rhizoctonia solani TaxID=456999 RepID=A0A8H3CLU7_9AGAM|nr:unnamed protein product [Rhizoctonia solani]